MSSNLPKLAVIGGTGKEGSGLALRWASAGYPVFIGGRSAEKAVSMASELNGELGAEKVSGCDNLSAAQVGDIIILSVPYAAQMEVALSIAPALHGKILIDVTVPLVPPAVWCAQLPPDGSAAVALQKRLGEDVKVVSAFQNISAWHLRDLQHQMDCDVLVCGDDQAARDTVIELAAAAGLRGFHAGPLANSVVAEALTSVLISINRRYKVPASGIRITGV